MRLLTKSFVLVVTLTCLGCTHGNPRLYALLEPKGYMPNGESYGEWKARNSLILSKFVGYPAAKLEAEVGPPQKKVKDVAMKGQTFDEQWIYRFSRGVPLFDQSIWAADFYFRDQQVVEIRIR